MVALSSGPLVGPATHFVSHAWCYEFELFCLALYSMWNEMPKAERIKCYFWIDIFCVDQHKAAAGLYNSAFWDQNSKTWFGKLDTRCAS